MAYTVDDLFGSDNLLGDPNDLDNLVEFGDAGNNSNDDGHDEAAGEEADDENENGGQKKDSQKKADDKKTVRIKRPQPKLDPERLKGPRGLKELKKSFADIKFQGKGHEAEDLQKVMARLEHWSHRLFPKFQFDDFLEKVEKLGSKKVVQNYVKRLRMGLEEEDDGVVRAKSDDEEEAVDNPDPVVDERMNEFDRLLAEQVSLHEHNSLHVSSPRTPGVGALRTPGTQQTPFMPPSGRAVSPTPVSTNSNQQSSLTAEQKARIERNRLAAMEKRRTRMSQRAQETGQAQDAVGDNAAPKAAPPKAVRHSPRRQSVVDVAEPSGPVPAPQPAPEPAPGPAPAPGPGPGPSPDPVPVPDPERSGEAPESAPAAGGGDAGTIEEGAEKADETAEKTEEGADKAEEIAEKAEEDTGKPGDAGQDVVSVAKELLNRPESSDALAILAADLLERSAEEEAEADSQGSSELPNLEGNLDLPPAPGLGNADLCLSETSSSSGDVNVVIDNPAVLSVVESAEPAPGESKSGGSSSGDDESSDPRKSSSNSSGSSETTKRSTDDEEPGIKKQKLASPTRSEENTSWGLAAFMEKIEQKSEKAEGQNQCMSDDSDDDIEIINVANNP